MTIVIAPPASVPATGLTFLQLAQKLRRKCRVSGTGPSALTGQSEEYLRLIEWINEAWIEIQTAHEDWEFMRTSCSFTTVLGQATYTPTQIGLADFGNWNRDSFRNYLTATGVNSEMYLGYDEYDAWRDKYQFGSLRNTPTRPFVMTVTPDKSIGLGPVPLDGYTVLGDYYRAPSELVAASDIPALPARFHMLIVYGGMKLYGVSEAASEVYQEGAMKFKKMMGRLELNQLPDITLASPLA